MERQKAYHNKSSHFLINMGAVSNGDIKVWILVKYDSITLLEDITLFLIEHEVER